MTLPQFFAIIQNFISRIAHVAECRSLANFCNVLLFAMVFPIVCGFLSADDTDTLQPSDLSRMTFDDLMQVKIMVPAAITHLTEAETPASVTLITAEDIKHTPARNIYDLIEVYVPGALWMNYEDGPQLGVRGNIANRNFKYLLRVNGRVMNNKGHYGAKSELEQWNLSDIQRIEIVRGPGSVIYGPGAVAGVINIITHNAASAEGLKVAAQYVDKYNSKGLTISHGLTKEKFSLYSFASITRTKGFAAPHFMGTIGIDAGYVGEDILPDSKPLDYFADYQGEPQIKMHLDIDFLDHWRFWSRYTQQGSTWKGNEVKTLFDNQLYNQQGVRDRQLTGTLQYDNQLRENISISAMASADASDVERRRERADNPDPDHILNKEIDFSETELFFRTLVNWQTSERIEIALGTEYSWDFFGAGWGDDIKNMRLGERGHIINGPSSNALEPGVTGSADRFGNELFVGDGWHTNTHSFFMETNISHSARLKSVVSGRIDKNTFSDWLFSPRIALISNVAEGHVLKIVAQQSQRMSTAGQLLALNQDNISPESETISAIELIYSTFTKNKLSFSVSTYWNDAQVIAWDNSIESTNLVGDLQVFGIEPELRYKWKNGVWGLSYSLAKQLDWQLAPGVPSSGVSYADFNQPLSGSPGAVLTAIGNDLNNWYNQTLKFHGRVTLVEKLTMHVDTRLLWDYQGARDGLTGLANAVDGLPVEADVLAAITKVETVGTYDYDFRLNASIDYELSNNFSVQVFAQNLLGRGRNKRYSYDFSGTHRAAPDRVRFTEEPTTWGVHLEYGF